MTSADAPQLVVPFAGERYAREAPLSTLIAPPYDVIGPQERERLAHRDAHNIVHLILPVGDGDRYAHAAALLEQWRAAGVLRADETPALTVVQQEFTTPAGRRLVRTGLIGGVHVEPFGAGRVRPHERTHTGPKEDRLALMRAMSATCEALLMLTRDAGGRLATRLTELAAGAPDASAELQGVQVRLWYLDGEAAEGVSSLASREPLYIADGHHRYETALTYRASNSRASRVPALIVPIGDPGLVVLPTHRILFGRRPDRERIVAELREQFQMRELDPKANYLEALASLQERGTGAVVVLPGGGALALLMKSGVGLGDSPFASEPSVAALDVARVDELVVKRIRSLLGAEAGVDYSADPDEVIDRVRSEDAVVGVLLNPTPVEHVLAVADAGASMPQKSTYFMPKVPSGLVVMSYDDP